MLAREISRPQWRSERESQPVPPTSAGEENDISELSGGDFRAIRSCMRRAGKGRAVPPDTAPLELWDMILSPEHGIPEDNAGA
eukprot:7378038-Pyramimonas_sp.AAC.1